MHSLLMPFVLALSPPAGDLSYAAPIPAGNYADLLSSDLRVYNDGFGGQNTPNSGETWSQFIAAVGSTDVGFISLDLDGGFTSSQEMLVSDFQVNNADLTATPLPAALPLFMGGLGMIGLVRRRRKRKDAGAQSAAAPGSA
jgi:hypothetical protein